MATYLDLCREVARESGTLAGGTTLSTLAGATGRAARIAGWVRDAWTNIQNERTDWRWMRRDYDAATVAQQMVYTAADLGIARLAALLTDRPDYRPHSLWDPVRGVADESTLGQISYETWRARYWRGWHDATRPTEYALSPAGDLCLGAKPDKVYPLRGEYRLAPQTLTLDGDVPEMPAEHHRIIVDEALRLMGVSDEGVTLIQTATAEVRTRRFALVRDQLPDIVVNDGPLA